MKDSIELPGPQRRSLEVTAKVIETTLAEMETLLRSDRKGQLTRKVEPCYTPEEKARMLGAIADMRQANTEMILHLGLRSSYIREDQILNARISHMWAVLCDSTSKGLKGFGGLPPGPAQAIDDHVNELLELLKKIV
ncbi:MAG TPA: hypothetical protein VL126_06450 [Bacteroidota bacterium]|nr:hypothetical protein [Bacteroidota bacterium]